MLIPCDGPYKFGFRILSGVGELLNRNDHRKSEWTLAFCPVRLLWASLSLSLVKLNPNPKCQLNIHNLSESREWRGMMRDNFISIMYSNLLSSSYLPRIKFLNGEPLEWKFLRKVMMMSSLLIFLIEYLVDTFKSRSKFCTHTSGLLNWERGRQSIAAIDA